MKPRDTPHECHATTPPSIWGVGYKAILLVAVKVREGMPFLFCRCIFGPVFMFIMFNNFHAA